MREKYDLTYVMSHTLKKGKKRGEDRYERNGFPHKTKPTHTKHYGQMIIFKDS
jgi:hypothetical protein